MRIAVVASLVTPLLEAQAGGAQAFLADLARGLSARHEVEVYCAAGSDIRGVRLVPIPVGAGAAAARVMPGGPEAAPNPELRAGFERLFRELAARAPDAVSQHAFDAEAFDLSEGLPVLHTLHLPPLTGSMIGAVVRSHGALVTVSESSRREWERVGVSCGVIRNGIPDFDPGRPETRPVALIPGRISPEKGTAIAIRAARRAGLAPLVVGDPYDPEYFRREVLPLLAGGELSPAVPRPRLWSLMASSAVTLLAVDWEEPFGLVAAEAQVAGCPVAGYHRGALPEVVNPPEGGILVRPGDFDALVEAIGSVRGFDRAAIRRQARRRLLIESTISGYERALEAL